MFSKLTDLLSDAINYCKYLIKIKLKMIILFELQIDPITNPHFDLADNNNNGKYFQLHRFLTLMNGTTKFLLFGRYPQRLFVITLIPILNIERLSRLDYL